MKKVALTLSFATSVALAAAIGAHFAVKHSDAEFDVELAATQAMLNFNHLERFAELESDLVKGCYAQALEKVRISKAEESMLLAEFLKQYPDTWVTTYVSDRDATLVERLKSHKNSYDPPRQEPPCAR